MDEPKRKGRRAYLNDFKKNENGEYIYQGTLYSCQEQGEGRRRTLMMQLVLCAAVLAVKVAAGCIPAPGMEGSIYVLLPYAAGLIAIVSVLWGMCRLLGGGEPLREYIYEATVPKLPLRMALAAGCAGLAIAGELIQVILCGAEEKLGYMFLFFLLEACVLAATLVLRQKFRRLIWKPVENIGKMHKNENAV